MSARRPITNQRLVALGIVLVVAAGVVFWFRFAPYGMSLDEAEAAVQRLGTANAQYFYLGEEVDGHRLARVEVDSEDGRMIFEYGRCMDHDEGGCNRPLNVYSTPTQDDRSEEGQRGCVKIRQVMDQGQIVDIGSSMVEITYWKTIPDGYMTDFKRSKALIPQLRRVGESEPSLCSQPTP
jgi:hypothetical protein